MRARLPRDVRPDPSGRVTNERGEDVQRPAAAVIATTGPPQPAGGGGLRLVFGRGGNAGAHCRSGWSEPEEGETWCVGARSTLVLPLPPGAEDGGAEDGGAMLLLLHVRPHVGARLAAQRLRVTANGTKVGDFTLHRRTARACVIPAAALRGRGVGRPATLELAFDTPDAARPADVFPPADSLPPMDRRAGQPATDRRAGQPAAGGDGDTRALAVAFASLRLYPDRLDAGSGAGRLGGEAPVPVDFAAVLAADRLPLAELMGRFESLGQNCEFGLVQRRAGAEPLGLLRFASTPLANLLAALEADFAGMGDADAVRVTMAPNGREFMVTDARDTI